jgi:hypothetical protein
MAKNDKLEERSLKILDASIKEDEGTEDSPKVVKTLWLLLQDIETENVFSSLLTLDDIRSITGMDRDLQGRELYNLATALRSREMPVKLVINPNVNEINPETINEKTED